MSLEGKYLCFLLCCLGPRAQQTHILTSDFPKISGLVHSGVSVHDIRGTLDSRGNHHVVGDEFLTFLSWGWVL